MALVTMGRFYWGQVYLQQNSWWGWIDDVTVNFIYNNWCLLTMNNDNSKWKRLQDYTSLSNPQLAKLFWMSLTVLSSLIEREDKRKNKLNKSEYMENLNQNIIAPAGGRGQKAEAEGKTRGGIIVVRA